MSSLTRALSRAGLSSAALPNRPRKKLLRSRLATQFVAAEKEQRELERMVGSNPIMQFGKQVMEQSGSSVGLEQWQFRVEGRLDASLLRAAFEQVIARHSILRTAFVTSESGEPVQIVMPNAVLPWREQDWRPLDANARQSALQREFDQDARTRLDPSRPPLASFTA